MIVIARSPSWDNQRWSQGEGRENKPGQREGALQYIDILAAAGAEENLGIPVFEDDGSFPHQHAGPGGKERGVILE